MNKNHVVKFVVTKDQKQRIQMNAEASGYATVSDFLRAIAVNARTDFFHRFNKLYERMMGETDA